MTTSYLKQLDRICGDTESLPKARELLNLAQTKTGPGSGHNLGASTPALPAICAFLASEWLGNNDVAEKVAQQASCIHPKAFQAALNTTRAALADVLKRQKSQGVSYNGLVRKYGLNSDAMYWIEEVDKELRKNAEELKDLEVAEDSIVYCVFYWTCIALHIRTVKSSVIVSGYGVPLREFQDIQALLNSICRDLQESIDKQLSSNRSLRFTEASPSKLATESPRKLPTQVSGSKTNSSVEGSPLKRKTSLPALPFISPVKKPRTVSPIKLNRISIGPGITKSNATAGPSKTPSPMKLNRIPTVSDATATPVTSTRLKTYGSTRTIKEPPVKPAEEESGKEDTLLTEQEVSTSTSMPVKAIGECFDQMVLIDKTPSKPPSKTSRKGRPIPGLTTPTRRGRPPRRATRVTTEQNEAEVDRPEEVVEDEYSSSSEEEEEKKPLCRHRIQPFPDRQFYLYKDPRTVREWEVCETNIESMIQKLGYPFDINVQAIVSS